MRAGIGVMGLIILLIFGGLLVVAVIGTLGRRRSASTGPTNQPHPELKQCPGCGAPTATNLDVCPHCGLRISA